MSHMDVFDAVKARKSIRSYQSKPVPEEVLMKVLESARLAPSAVNRQPWHFVVVTDAEKRKKLSAGPFAGFLKESPVVIVGCGDTRASPRWHVVDVSIAMQQMVLTATSEGLAACWIGSFNEKKVKELLGIPDKFKVIALLAMGYQRGKRGLASKLIGSHKRKDIGEIVSFDVFGENGGV
jgi:nitroreductase